MSMTMMALRIAAVEALKNGGTLVGSNVLDSQISAIDLTADGALTSDEQKPFIAVYSDRARSTDLGSTGLRTNGQVEISFNFGVSLAMAETDRVTGESQVIEGFPATDAHFELVLDVLDLQITRALTDPGNEWAQVFGAFVNKWVAKDHLRSSNKGNGARLAAGQIRLTAECFADPALNQPLAENGPWRRLMSLLEASGLPQHAMLSELLGTAEEGLYPPFESLLSMTSGTAGRLKLYDYDDLGRAVTIAEAASFGTPTGG